MNGILQPKGDVSALKCVKHRQHRSLLELYLGSCACTGCALPVIFYSCLSIKSDIPERAPCQALLGFPGVDPGECSFPLGKINCTKSTFLFSRLIHLDTKHSCFACLAWQACVMAFQYLQTKNRHKLNPTAHIAYDSPDLLSNAGARA